MKAQTSEIILRLLNTSYIDNIDMTEALGMGIATVVLDTDDALLLVYGDSGVYSGTCNTEEGIPLVKDAAMGCDLLCLHGKIGVSECAERLGLQTIRSCHQVALTHACPPPDARFLAQHSMRTLNVGDLPIVTDHYHLASEEYLCNRLEQGAMTGLFDLEGTMLGFIGLHAEGSMGMLEVFPPYRGNGCATVLEEVLCQKLQSQGHVPFAHIYDDNAASIALQRKLGLDFGTRSVYWLS